MSVESVTKAQKAESYNDEPFGEAASGSNALTDRSSLISYLSIGLMAAAGAVLALYVTRFGPGAAGDSTSYLMGAENLIAGNGYSRFSGGYEIRPITGFPPGYSAALAMVGVLGIPLMEAGRWLNAVIFAANIALIGGMVFWFTRSRIAAIFAGLLLLTRATQLELHTWVMSEPLFILLSLVGIGLIAFYLARQQVGWLIAGALVAVAATLTRYTGAALIGTGIIGTLAFGPRALGRRLRDSVLFGMASALPVYLWLLRNRAVSGTLVNRELSYHPMEPDLIRLFLADFSSWFVPHELPLPTGVRAALALLIAGGAVVGLAVLGRKWMRRDQTRLELVGPSTALRGLPWLLGVFAAGNLAIIWINSSLLDAATTATAPPRYLAPVFASVLALFCMASAYLARHPDAPRLARPAIAMYAIVLVAFFAADSLAAVRDPLPYLGYTGRKYLWSELVSQLNQVPEQTPIVSNNPEMVYILADRPAYVRPISYDPYRDQPRDDYEQQFSGLEDKIGSGALFVVFDEIEPDDQAVIDRFGLNLLAEFPAARIYGQLRESARNLLASPSYRVPT